MKPNLGQLVLSMAYKQLISTVELGFKGRQDKRKLDFKRQIASDQLFM